jgi:PPP family 3-phenylpropionic acid transporter
MVAPPTAPPTTQAPYWRLSGFYLFYFATLGAFLPYWGLFLQHQGYQPAEIGELLAILMGTKVIAPNIWGWIADHTGQRMSIVRLASLCAFLSFCGVFANSASYWWLAGNMMVFSFFWNAALPQFEANTFNFLGPRAQRYSSIRLWGSIGFILVALTLGPWLDARGADILPVVLAVLFAAIWVSSLLVPDSRASVKASEHDSFADVLRGPLVIWLLLVSFLMQASHGAYYSFYSILLEAHGYSKGTIGQLWTLGVVAEILVFLLMGKLLPHYGPRNLLVASLALTTIRWLLIPYFVDDMGVLIFAQVLHAASFGLFHAVAISLVHQLFTGPNQVRGQALYSSMSFGAGGALGSYAAGHLWGAMGALVTFVSAAAVALVGAVVVIFGMRELESRQHEPAPR